MNVTMPFVMPTGSGHGVAEQNGGAGRNTAEFILTTVHVVVAPPTNVNSRSQV